LDIFSYATGEKIRGLKSHSNEVSAIEVDFINKLFISASWDSSIYVSKENEIRRKIDKKDDDKKFNPLKKRKAKNIALREIKNSHNNKEICLLELSTYHNIFITSASNNEILVWNYEFCKLMGCIKLEENDFAVSFEFINGFSLLLVGTNSGKIIFINFHIKNNMLSFNMEAHIILYPKKDSLITE